MYKIVLMGISGAFVGVAGAVPAFAEFHCEAKVGYTVEMAPAPTPAGTPSVGAKEVPPAPPRENSVYLAVLEGNGADEPAAKAAVQKESGRQIERVREECRVRHENVGGCIASKFQTNAATIKSLGFQARKALEDALQKDCESQRGICRKVEVTEPVCHEIVVKAVESVSPEAEAKGKDDKKKGKK